MKINNIEIWDTFAEAFPMKCSRLIVTAQNLYWAKQAAESFCGFATSVIACGCEIGIEKILSKDKTPDNRPGISILIFSVSSKELEKQILNRAGQCVMTSPTSALFSGNKGEIKIKLGNALRYFGDGYQISKMINEKRYWRVPVMDGEFLCEEFAYQMQGIGGGNFLILADTVKNALKAAEEAVKAMKKIKNTILPFPGGVVRSGSKVGSKYKSLIASTNFEYCPSIKSIVNSKLGKDIGAVLEIVIDGLTENDISNSIKAGINAILKMGPNTGIKVISAGNYGGKLGPYHFHIRKIIK
tara:strand:- start:22091 stop:22987 length:897 start_codon:yes stop_codon:yes gene_type:complete